jgi:diguanylate cyclase (GGDEF)-like protein/PAS domain S-box-containing protein
MIDRYELMEAALEGFPEGLVLLSREDEVACWNRAAENITGFPSMETLSRKLPWALHPLLLERDLVGPEEPRTPSGSARYTMIHVQHHSGRDIPILTRAVVLRDTLGERFGTALIFHSAEGVEMLPHPECDDESTLEASQDEIEEQAKSAFADFTEREIPFGLLWVTVDQAPALRRTHGRRACEAMIERVERALAHGLRPAEELGRWGNDEFLILCHESSASALASHAQLLTGLARTSDFRWWGDRLSLTVSVGAAQAAVTEPLALLFERAQAAMRSSVHAGGNHITLAPERLACSSS